MSSHFDISVRQHLLREISNVFNDGDDDATAGSATAQARAPRVHREPLVYDVKPRVKRHDSMEVEEVVPDDPFADVQPEETMVVEPSIEFEDIKEEPIDRPDDYEEQGKDDGDYESEQRTHLYLEDFQDATYEVMNTVEFYEGQFDAHPTPVTPTFMCQTCNSVFAEENRLRIHMRREHGLLSQAFKYNCDVCGMSYDQKNSLIVHVKRKHDNTLKEAEDTEELTCNVCASVLVGKRRMRFHMLRKHEVVSEPFQYKCKKCPHQYDRWKSLEMHMRRKHKFVPTKSNEHFACPLCPKHYTNRPSYITHVKRKHKRKPGQSEETKKTKPAAVQNKDTEDEDLQCVVCASMFTSSNRLRLHMRRKHNALKDAFLYKCSHCSLTYDKKASLIRHMQRKHNKDWLCKTCNQQFTTQALFNEHSHGEPDLKKEDQVYQCEICKMIYLREFTLVKHMKLSHGVDQEILTSFCDQCGKGFIGKKSLNLHLKSEHATITYTCRYCGLEFVVKESLKNHITNKHPPHLHDTFKKLFRCERDDCGQVFTSEPELCDHYMSSHGEVSQVKTEAKDDKPQILKCSECKIEFDSWVKLRYHIKSKHCQQNQKANDEPPKELVCQHCGLVFTIENELTRHLRFEHKDQFAIYKCDKCKYKTWKKDLLYKHSLGHTKEKKFGCMHEGCEYKSHNKYHYVKHLQTHLEKVRLKCTYCPYETNDTHLMKNHTIEHETGKKRYPCDKCDYSTNLPASIIQHRFKHGDERKFKCNLCPFTAKYSTSLWLHNRQKHSDKPKYVQKKRVPKKKKIDETVEIKIMEATEG